MLVDVATEIFADYSIRRGPMLSYAIPGMPAIAPGNLLLSSTLAGIPPKFGGSD
jgi:hypothetical protein